MTLSTEATTEQTRRLSGAQRVALYSGAGVALAAIATFGGATEAHAFSTPTPFDTGGSAAPVEKAPAKKARPHRSSATASKARQQKTGDVHVAKDGRSISVGKLRGAPEDMGGGSRPSSVKRSAAKRPVVKPAKRPVAKPAKVRVAKDGRSITAGKLRGAPEGDLSNSSLDMKGLTPAQRAAKAKANRAEAQRIRTQAAAKRRVETQRLHRAKVVVAKDGKSIRVGKLIGAPDMGGPRLRVENPPVGATIKVGRRTATGNITDAPQSDHLGSWTDDYTATAQGLTGKPLQEAAKKAYADAEEKRVRAIADGLLPAMSPRGDVSQATPEARTLAYETAKSQVNREIQHRALTRGLPIDKAVAKVSSDRQAAKARKDRADSPLGALDRNAAEMTRLKREIAGQAGGPDGPNMTVVTARQKQLKRAEAARPALVKEAQEFTERQKRRKANPEAWTDLLERGRRQAAAQESAADARSGVDPSGLNLARRTPGDEQKERDKTATLRDAHCLDGDAALGVGLGVSVCGTKHGLAITPRFLVGVAAQGGYTGKDVTNGDRKAYAQASGKVVGVAVGGEAAKTLPQGREAGSTWAVKGSLGHPLASTQVGMAWDGGSMPKAVTASQTYGVGPAAAQVSETVQRTAQGDYQPTLPKLAAKGRNDLGIGAAGAVGYEWSFVSMLNEGDYRARAHGRQYRFGGRPNYSEAHAYAKRRADERADIDAQQKSAEALDNGRLESAFQQAHPGVPLPSDDRLRVDRWARSQGIDTTSPGYRNGGYVEVAKAGGMSGERLAKLAAEKRY